MTNDEKAKAYDEAIKKAKEIKEKIVYSHLSTESCKAVSEYIDTIIPELRESEDERMIREFNDWLCEEIEWRTNDVRDEKDRITLNMLRYVLTKAKDWLEKQKETLHISESCKENADSFTSEDERINKAIFKALSKKDARDVLLAEGVQVSEALSYLEKQKEYHIPWYDYQKSKEAGYTIVPNEEYEQLIKQKEQNPAWSEEDEDMLNSCISSIEEAKENRYVYKETDGDTSYDLEISFLKSLRPQPKQEWNEEDEDIRDTIIRDLKHLGGDIVNVNPAYKKEIDWLKSLRPQPHWKPSKEQIATLEKWLKDKQFDGASRYIYPIFESLYEQLRKLM